MNDIITIRVSPTGAIHVRTQGTPGPGCLSTSRTLEQALGAQAGVTLTPEYQQQPPVVNRDRLRLAQ